MHFRLIVFIAYCAIGALAARIAVAEVLWSEAFGDTDGSQRLVIDQGSTVRFDVCVARVDSLTVNGSFRVDSAHHERCPSASLKLNTLMISGPSAVFAIGTQQAPHQGHFELVLGGQVDAPGVGMAEQRQIMVMNGARLALFGASRERRSWTQLSRHALMGATEIEVAESTQWQVGDEIVIAASNIDPREAEVVTVTSVSGDSRTLGVSPPLQFDHFGDIQHYGDKMLDSRAEVGLLSHSITIRGDESSLDTGIGGNIMVMNQGMDRPSGHPAELLRPPYSGSASVIQLEGVEFVHMGQRGRAGRYPIHLHLLDDASESYVRDISIHHGFQRAVNVHGADFFTVERVVAYHIENHMFVASEEGDEVFNRFIDNLGILALPPKDDLFAFPSASNPNRSEQSEERHAVFWMRNSLNTLRGNHAAGAWLGQGFFFDHGGFNGRSRRYAFENATDHEMCDFSDNLAHSIYVGLGSPDWYTPTVKGFGLFSNGHHFRDEPTTCTLRGFTAYKTQNGGAWLEEHTVIVDAIIADSHTGVIAGDRVHDVVVVGQTANKLRAGGLPGKSDVAHPDRNRGGFAQSNNGGQRIDGRQFTDIQCLGLPTCFFAQTSGEGVISQLDDAVLDRVRLASTPQGFATVSDPVQFAADSNITFGRFVDVDGAMTGQPGRQGSTADPVFLEINDYPPNRWGWEWNASVNESFATGRIFHDAFQRSSTGVSTRNGQ